MIDWGWTVVGGYRTDWYDRVARYANHNGRVHNVRLWTIWLGTQSKYLHQLVKKKAGDSKTCNALRACFDKSQERRESCVAGLNEFVVVWNWVILTYYYFPCVTCTWIYPSWQVQTEMMALNRFSNLEHVTEAREVCFYIMYPQSPYRKICVLGWIGRGNGLMSQYLPEETYDSLRYPEGIPRDY